MKRLVMIGNGMAGIACLEQILKLRKDLDVTVFGDETHVNYNRILLSSVLAGEKLAEDIVLNPIEWYAQNGIHPRLGVAVEKIDREARVVVDSTGRETPFDLLVIATGSSAFVPPVEGVNKENIHVFRTLDDTRALLEKAERGRKAVVIGGGLLGLEAARGLQVQGCDVSVVHLMDTLMERQLDPTGGAFLKRKMESMGVRVLLGRKTDAFLGNGHVKGLRFSDGEQVDAELVVVAAGIRPNAKLAREAGLNVNRGIVVDDEMRTSDPAIFAVGECAEHRGVVYGLVAPLYEQGKALAAAVAGRETRFTGARLSTRLKIMGVDVFSAGEIEDGPGMESVRYEDPALGIYKRLLLREGRLVGVILVGDISDERRYMSWLNSGEDLSSQRKHLLFPAPTADVGLNVASMPDGETVCGCMGVTKGAIVEAIHAHGICTMAELKDKTRASTGCGSCAGTCASLLQAVAPGYEDEANKAICGCLPFSQDQLRTIIQTQQLKSVQDVLEIYGNAAGCPVCKPALSYLVDVVWCGDHREDRSARFINDRVHANIQKDGTFSVVPRMRGGVTTPQELRRIADVAEKYQVPLVKVTGSQRLDLLGVKKADLPAVWDELGMPSGQAYAKGLRMVKTCVGNQFCRFGTQDAMATGIELEERLENLYTPHKFKLAVVGCPRNCAEATVKDVGLIGQEGSWQVVVGGAAGKGVRKADLLTTVETTEQAIEASELFFQYYRENGSYLERSYDFVERLGIEKVRKETIYAPAEVKQGLLERLRKSKAKSYDAWLERHQPRPTQFVTIQPMEVQTV